MRKERIECLPVHIPSGSTHPVRAPLLSAFSVCLSVFLPPQVRSARSRGRSLQLQVFFTREGKGWGLRTLEDIPKGAFVCEYAGEVLTSAELYERAVDSAKNGKHLHQVLLDANWGSEGVLMDKEALGLDGTFYGNIGRFINHRCYDANLVQIPVEVETPDHHYYHLAFFTTKKVEAFEELTWDYGIDFEEEGGPSKVFRCMCGSRYCRDPTNPRRMGRAAARRN